VVFYRNRDGPATGWSAGVPLCLQFSEDEGRTWSWPPAVVGAGRGGGGGGGGGGGVIEDKEEEEEEEGGAAGGPYGVEPNVVVLNNRTVVVVGGRNGLFAWATGAGNLSAASTWRVFNIAAHHNEARTTHTRRNTEMA